VTLSFSSLICYFSLFPFCVALGITFPFASRGRDSNSCWCFASRVSSCSRESVGSIDSSEDDPEELAFPSPNDDDAPSPVSEGTEGNGALRPRPDDPTTPPIGFSIASRLVTPPASTHASPSAATSASGSSARVCFDDDIARGHGAAEQVEADAPLDFTAG